MITLWPYDTWLQELQFLSNYITILQEFFRLYVPFMARTKASARTTNILASPWPVGFTACKNKWGLGFFSQSAYSESLSKKPISLLKHQKESVKRQQDWKTQQTLFTLSGRWISTHNYDRSARYSTDMTFTVQGDSCGREEVLLTIKQEVPLINSSDPSKGNEDWRFSVNLHTLNPSQRNSFPF